MTLREIAEIEGVSHQCIAEILERALLKVRKILLQRGLTLEDIL
jgi:predicted DNA binding protein